MLQCILQQRILSLYVVKKYLQKNFNLPEERFVAVGHGSENPVATNETEAGRQQNRRTDIKVVLNLQ